jgi:prepilin-type N-terminal cleavage/methylation domain-containing protein
MMPRPATRGFTLIEVLAAVFLTAVVMTVAIAFYVSLSDSTDAAAQKARTGRLALAIIDRIARDLEGAYLLSTPAEVDPLFHPWSFIAQSQEGESASDRIHFITRNHRPRNLLGHGSDVAVVTYLLNPDDDGPGFELLRAVRPGVPDEAEHEFLPADDELFMVVAEHVDRFGLRFMSEESELLDEWDSTQLEQSGQLPLAVEIELAFLDLDPAAPRDEFDPNDFGTFDSGHREGEGETYLRRVPLPMRAIDLAAMLQESVDETAAEEQAQEDAEEEADGEADDDPFADDDEGDLPDEDQGQRQPNVTVPLSGAGGGAPQ